MELTKERLITIVSAAGVIIVLGLYLFLYQPLINKLRRAHLECKKIEAEVLRAHEAISSLKTTPIEKKLIGEEDASLAIDELTRQGKLQGINFISITPKQIERQLAPYKILPIEIETESSYENLGIFLGKLDDLKTSLVKVGKFDTTPNELNPKTLITKLSVSMYFEDEE